MDLVGVDEREHLLDDCRLMVLDLKQIFLAFGEAIRGEELSEEFGAVGQNGLVARELDGAALNHEVGEDGVGQQAPLRLTETRVRINNFKMMLLGQNLDVFDDQADLKAPFHSLLAELIEVKAVRRGLAVVPDAAGSLDLPAEGQHLGADLQLPEQLEAFWHATDDLDVGTTVPDGGVFHNEDELDVLVDLREEEAELGRHQLGEVLDLGGELGDVPVDLVDDVPHDG